MAELANQQYSLMPHLDWGRPSNLPLASYSSTREKLRNTGDPFTVLRAEIQTFLNSNLRIQQCLNQIGGSGDTPSFRRELLQLQIEQSTQCKSIGEMLEKSRRNIPSARHTKLTDTYNKEKVKWDLFSERLSFILRGTCPHLSPEAKQLSARDAYLPCFRLHEQKPVMCNRTPEILNNADAAYGDWRTSIVCNENCLTIAECAAMIDEKLVPMDTALEEEQNRQMREIMADVEALNEIFRETAEMLEEHGEGLNECQENIHKAEENVKGAVSELTEAERLTMKRRRLAIAITTGAAVGITVGVVGVVMPIIPIRTYRTSSWNRSLTRSVKLGAILVGVGSGSATTAAIALKKPKKKKPNLDEDAAKKRQ